MSGASDNAAYKTDEPAPCSGEFTPLDAGARRSRRLRFVVLVMVVDAAVLFLATVLATVVRFATPSAEAVFGNEQLPRIPYGVLGLILTAIWMVLLAWARLYDMDRMFTSSDEGSRIIRAVSTGVVLFILVTYALKLPAGVARLWTLLSWALAIALVAGWRALLKSVIRRARKRGRILQPALIVGSNAEARHLKQRLLLDRSSGLLPVAYLRSSSPGEKDEIAGFLPCLGTADDLSRAVVSSGVDSVVIAVSAFGDEAAARMIADIRLMPVDVNLSAGLSDVITKRVFVREASGMPLISVKGVSFSRSNRLTKRIFDLCVAGGIVLLGLPAWILIALSIKLTSPGPLLFKQARTGLYGREFMMLKFRSMRADAESLQAELVRDSNEADGPIFKMKADPRVTRVGRVLRKFSLDEFPQLLNVLKGEMSVVGPRPLPTYETQGLTEEQQRRHEVPPGLTGLWQVSGRSHLTFDEMVRLDLFYIENWSVGLDWSLLARTIPVVLLSEGAY